MKRKKTKIAPAFKCETIITTTTNSSDTAFYSNYRNQNVYTIWFWTKKKKIIKIKWYRKKSTKTCLQNLKYYIVFVNLFNKI